MALSATRQKLAGAYYTDALVARFLAAWAIRKPADRVLEPCFGEGVFLDTVMRQLRSLGDDVDVVGVDLDRDAYESARVIFPDARLHVADFFTLTPGELGQFDVVIGNPPFIRYQYFAGEERRRALERAAQRGVTIPALASAWAPFLVHAVSHLRFGGRLAMVAPFEITYARYARPVVAFLARSFREVHCLTFESPLFPHLSENTVLLLCDGLGASTPEIQLHRFRSAESLRLPLAAAEVRVPVGSWATGAVRTALFDLPPACRELYLELAMREEVRRLGGLMNVNIGYVTGDNDFFHLSSDAAHLRGLAPRDLRAAVRRGSDLNRVGFILSPSDISRITSHGAHWLFLPEEPLSAAAAAYVKEGEDRGVHRRYKCRVRSPWYRVPGVTVPDMLVSVFSSGTPRLVANRGGAVATNSVLALHRRNDMKEVDVLRLAASALTTLGQLSAEIEGHALGGGALKLEPFEAKLWALPYGVEVHTEELEKVDRLLRDGRLDEAVHWADTIFLQRGLNMKESDLEVLRDGVIRLRSLRCRGRRAADA